MYLNFNGSKIFFQVEGSGKNFVVFLCGWGYDSEVLRPLAKKIGCKGLFVDFPCFGKSENVMTDWNVEDYADLVYQIIKKVGFCGKVKIVAHSFGGKVAIWLEKKYNVVESLVLVASAGIKPKKNLLKWWQVKRFKSRKQKGKSVLGFGSEEYRALPECAKKTFVNVVNTHIDDLCENILCDTLVIAGKNDKTTPIFMQKRLHKKIKNSKLVVFDGGHFVWLDDFCGVTNEIANFLWQVKKGE